MQRKNIKTIFGIVLVILVSLFVFVSIKNNPLVSEKSKVEDEQTLLSYFKFNILTHEGMNMSDIVPTFNGKDKEWDTVANNQLNRFLVGSPKIEKMISDPFVFSYKLVYSDGHIIYVIWFDDGDIKNTGPDTTVDINALDLDPKTDVVITERLLKGQETEPLIRGYLVDQNGHTKITITETPVFVYPQPL